MEWKDLRARFTIKKTANVEDIDKWIRVRKEMMLGNLSEGQMHQKLRDELNSVRDKI